MLGKDHADITDSFYTLAAIRRGLGDYKEALNLCQQGNAQHEMRLHARNSPVTTGRKSTSWPRILHGTPANWHVPGWAEFFLGDFGLVFGLDAS